MALGLCNSGLTLRTRKHLLPDLTEEYDFVVVICDVSGQEIDFGMFEHNLLCDKS